MITKTKVIVTFLWHTLW